MEGWVILLLNLWCSEIKKGRNNKFWHSRVGVSKHSISHQQNKAKRNIREYYGRNRRKITCTTISQNRISKNTKCQLTSILNNFLSN